MRQCHKRLWLEVHQPALREDSTQTRAIFDTGHQVGDLAQQLYDPQSLAKHRVINIDTMGFVEKAGSLNVFQQTQEWLKEPLPLFEAGFQSTIGHAGSLSFADVMLPVFSDQQTWRGEWRMVEVKSSTGVKDYYLDDLVVQSHNAIQSGVRLKSVALAHINNQFVYQGDGDYRGLLVEKDLTSVVFPRLKEATQWVQLADQICAEKTAPTINTGAHCFSPYACGFYQHCSNAEPKAEFTVDWLPRKSPSLQEAIAEINHEKLPHNESADMRDLPDSLLGELQKRVRDCTVNNTLYFNKEATRKLLTAHPAPYLFLDFETCMNGVPIWAGTRPYQQIPFQYSLHGITADGVLHHRAFLDLSGNDPSKALAQSLMNHVRELTDSQQPAMTIFAYNASFEQRVLRELATRFNLPPLSALNHYFIDLLPIVRNHYYHPAQKGSWSIKSVLPAMCPKFSYQNLVGVADGGMAMSAFAEATHPNTPPERKAQINQQLLEYCKLDTLGMVEIWKVLVGNININELQFRNKNIT